MGYLVSGAIVRIKQPERYFSFSFLLFLFKKKEKNKKTRYLIHLGCSIPSAAGVHFIGKEEQKVPIYRPSRLTTKCVWNP